MFVLYKMTESFNRRMIFFVITFLMYFMVTKLYEKIIPTSNFNLIITGLMFTLAIFGLFYLTRMDREGYTEYTGVGVDLSRGSGYVSGQVKGCSAPHDLFTVSPGKLCRGGWYMNQGDSCRAKMCQKLASTKEGQEELTRYNCGPGFNGMPGCGFEYTPMECRGASCSGCPSCNVEANGIF